MPLGYAPPVQHFVRPRLTCTDAGQSGHVVSRQPWCDHRSPEFTMHRSSHPFIPRKYSRTVLESWSYFVRNYTRCRSDRLYFQQAGAKKRRLEQEHALDRVKDTLQRRLERVAAGFQEWEAIGCSALELRIHLEKQFTGGMTWHNHGRVWFIDHILPRLTFRDEGRSFRFDNLRATPGRYEHAIYRAPPT